jgi:hypothetical protein
VIKYICFTSSEEFEKWQQENPRYQIMNIAPLVSGIDMQFDSPTEKVSGTTNIAVFVVYHIPIDTSQMQAAELQK